jgi:uncharacterized membrane-anchored protein
LALSRGARAGLPERRTVLPPDHSQRIELNNEVHARPSELLPTPMRAIYLALISPWSARDAEAERVGALAMRFGAPPPAQAASHYSADLGGFRLTWERHTEFSRYMLIFSGASSEPFPGDPLEPLLREWVATLPGELMVATRVAIERGRGASADEDRLAAEQFAGNALVGSAVAGEAADAYTDFRIHADGFGRLLVINRSLNPRQTGRIVQGLLEIDTYRMLALLALPVARALGPAITRCEATLAEVMRQLATVAPADEAQLLERLTRLEAEIDGRESDSDFRFGAAGAYYELVQRRVAELRETRLGGLQTLQEFTERRLAPAMNTCRAMASRQQSLSARVARATQLLSTRVGVTREAQNQALLESMNRRGALQLRLQGTVEGLSVAAITYYLVGLVRYACDGIERLGFAIPSSAIVVLSIPLSAFAVWLGIRRIRRLAGA